MTIDINGRVARDDFTLELDLRIPEGITMIAGPNGAGKTTLLRLVAGLEALDAGTLSIHDRPVDDPGAGVFVPAHRRSVAMAFQDHRLFPHLTVLDNVAFPLRRQGTARPTARAKAADHLDAVGLSDQADSRPGSLSIGQRQRAGLARALATPADVLLLDEPLASVDEASRLVLRRHLAGVARPTILWATHDPDDARDDDAHGPVRGHISVEDGVVRQTRPR